MLSERELREKLDYRHAELEHERAPFISHWRDLSRYILPVRGRFFTSERQRGGKRYNDIIDCTATLAARTLRSAMMSGITPQSRPWFQLVAPSLEISEDQDVKDWLQRVTSLCQLVFHRSNLYNVLPMVYSDMSVFGTACMYVDEDDRALLRFHSLPVGSYMISVDSSGRLNGLAREFEVSVQEVLHQFGERDPKTNKLTNLDIFSKYVKDAIRENRLRQTLIVRHHILENEDYLPDSLSPERRKWSSVYYERGPGTSSVGHRNDQPDKILRRSGSSYLPAFAPRWETTGNDSYGTNCPGMAILGDVKQLQHHERRVAQAIDKMVTPPMIGPSSLMGSVVSLLPGGLTYDDGLDGNPGLRPAHEVRMPLGDVEGKSQQIRERIRRSFYEDIALMLSTSDRRRTATEVQHLQAEKLTVFGPMLEQTKEDLLDPLFDVTLSVLDEAGYLPQRPDALPDYKVDYISVLAQAQKAAGVGRIDEVLARVSNLASLHPDVIDKINADEFVDQLADMYGLPARLVRSDEDVEILREQRAQAQQAQQQMEMMQQGAGVARDLSGADMGGGQNALTALLGAS